MTQETEVPTAKKKQLYVETDDKYVILSIDDDLKQICQVDDDKAIAAAVRELAAKAKVASPKQVDGFVGNGPHPNPTKADEYEGSAVDAVAELMSDPTVRQGVGKAWSFLQKISMHGDKDTPEE